MRISKLLRILTAVAVVASAYQPAMALPPPPGAPFTLWNFLGIPQGFQKVRDATTNKRGNHPALERKPPLKAIADPQNLMSANPAIAKAAEIKTQEDMAPQKVKAIKYLATIGCGCYPGVKEALMAALEDCTEEVRYQAVLAIEDAATMHCDVCNKNCCCDQELTLKLSQIAYEMTDKCTYLEPSERVREAAKSAMRACCPGQGPIGEDVVPVPAGETIPEGAPAPPGVGPEGAPPAPPAPMASRRGMPTRMATRPYIAASSKTVEPQSDEAVASDEDNVEIVTIDFGNDQIQAQRPAARSNSRKGMPTTPATKPASHKAQEPAASQRPLGQSSRRSAVERGLANRQTPSVSNGSIATSTPRPAPAKPIAAREPTPAPTAGPLKSLLAPVMNSTSSNDTPPNTPNMAVRASYTEQGAIRGKVLRVNVEASNLEVRVDRPGLKAGDRMKVSRDYLLDRGEVGYVEVVSVSGYQATVQPVGRLRAGQIQTGDVVVFGFSNTSTRTAEVE